jgi:hypothetical protein
MQRIKPLHDEGEKVIKEVNYRKARLDDDVLEIWGEDGL